MSYIAYLLVPREFRGVLDRTVPALDGCPASSTQDDVCSFLRISLWVLSSDIAMNWYSLSRDAIFVH
jgi:hypothetical protein